MTLKMQTFTIAVPVIEWMKSEQKASTLLLMSYLEDISESLEFRNTATACALDHAPMLWFTFASEDDANDFQTVINEIYNLGGWLIND